MENTAPERILEIRKSQSDYFSGFNTLDIKFRKASLKKLQKALSYQVRVLKLFPVSLFPGRYDNSFLS